MDKINTKEKGDKFEEKIYKIIEPLVTNGDLLVSPKNNKIFRQKKYYSKDRQDYIKFDITIESYLLNSEQYSILIVIECKDYKDRVSISDIEEFIFKLEQVAGKNVKGIMITTAKYPANVINIAKSRGIALSRIIEDELIWVTSRIDKYGLSTHEYIFNVLCGEDKPSKKFYCVDKYFYDSLHEFFLGIGVIDKCPSLEKEIVPYLSYEQIQNIANSLLSKNCFNKLETTNLLTEMINYLNKEYNVLFSSNKLKYFILYFTASLDTLKCFI